MEIHLVTGGTGFAGAHLVQALMAGGLAVRVITRNVQRARRVLPPDVEIIVGDITNPAVVDRAVSGASVVYHLATSYQEPKVSSEREWDVHVKGTRLLLERSDAEGVRRFVHCSTVGVLGHIAAPPADETWPYAPSDSYQETKCQGERLALAFAEAHDLPVTVVRPTAIYGPGDRRLLKLFQLIARRRFVMIGDGSIYYHMVYVEDLVRGIRLLSERPEAVGQVVIIGGDEYRSLEQVVALIADTLGVPRPRLHLPSGPIQQFGSLCEKLCRPLGITPPIYRRRVDFFTKSRAFSIDKARRLLDYIPRISLEEGIRRTAEWYFEHGDLARAPLAEPAVAAGTR
ncbi:MAG: NAD-dependent epimerase/dehydratase family protein [Gemmatimonadota bacterium]